MKEIVKYHNDLNKLNFSNLKEKELELFYSICIELKDKKEETVEINLNELKKYIEIYHNSRFKEYMKKVHEKFLSMSYSEQIGDELYSFSFFNEFKTNLRTGKMQIQVNKKFSYILNNLFSNYTKFEFIEFKNFKSKYSKIIFPLLKQWETVKKKEFSKDELFEVLGVPNSYRKELHNFNKKVLNVIKQDLSEVLENFQIKSRKNNKREIEAYIFTWKMKKEVIEAEIVEIKISAKLSKAIEKAKKNRFIANLFTDENIEKLLNKFEEPALIKGLNACYKDIQKDVKSLNYLIKAIETAAGKKTKKIVVEKEMDQEKTEAILKEKIPTIKKEKVLESEFAEIYKHYLMINDIEDNMFTKKAFAMNYEIADEIILPDELKKIVGKYAIDNEQVLHFMGAGSSREEAIRVIESNIIYNNRIPEEHIKEYEEFLAWKKWNEERMKKK
nr:replication initiation protein [uncultured Fusobacterium sp.]